MKRNKLYTDDTKLPDIPLSEYPRMQFRRDSYLCLNGTWDIAFSFNDKLPSTYEQKVIVPFPIESHLSSLNRTLRKRERIFYRKFFTLDSDFIKDKTILHFDAIDQIAEVYLNGTILCKHIGGYLPFSVDISKYVQKENELIVKVRDDLDIRIPYGKQSKKSKGMWYTKTSGIWKTVWLESVHSNHFENIKIDVTLNSVQINVFGNVSKKKLIIRTEKEDIVREFSGDIIKVNIKDPHLWTPNDPYLYYFDLVSEHDVIHSYFALRTISVVKTNGYPCLMLNNKPYFFHGLLDQGYFPDGLLTPKSYKQYEKEIIELKELGFNTLRKHIKIEPLYFYYLCDKLGMIVFQDFVNNGRYHYIHDTVLPTIGFTKRRERKLLSKVTKENFINHAKETVELLYNSPSVLYYTIFNEGWGQFDSDKMYDLVKSMDSSRIIDTTSGWFKQKKSDVESLHIYFKKIEGAMTEKPRIISEFGGFAYKDIEHCYNPKNMYGYKKFKNYEDLEKAVKKLYDEAISPFILKGIAGTIYTQVSDVEDETNGIFTYDRHIKKIKVKLIDKLDEINL
ncbi:MAG: glycoside hydrolase family 2 [Erysipelotrichales bacterium]|nr:glycoside hydrolase family 2 [Erysipelotrichales bacterium]